MTTDGTQSLQRALALLDEIVSDDGRTPMSVLAANLGLAASSARRMVATLQKHGLIASVAHGCYAGGPHLQSLASVINPHRSLIHAARPVLRHLARREQWTAHLGIFDNDMVSYLIKEGSEDLFTREGAQLEAYCTGIGKALLAQFPPHQLTKYLSGPFVRLTDTTICEGSELEAEIKRTRVQGFAIDNREMSDAVACVAVPILAKRGCVGAISLSGDARRFPLDQVDRIAPRLAAAAANIANHLLP